MRFLTRIAIFFYVSFISIIGGLAIMFVSRAIVLKDVVYYLNLTYHDDYLRIIVGLAGGAFILVSFLLAKMISGGEQKERTIAFDNPSGRVSISLSAVEDLVRRLLYRVPEIKEVKPHILATKRGIEIEARLILKADVNIPDMTSKVQDLIKGKIQDILGIDETVHVRIHVIKISSEEAKAKRDNEKVEEKKEPTVPFQGYRS